MRASAIIYATISISAVLALLSPNTKVFAQDFPKPRFNDTGELLRPDVSYREWVYVGTPSTPNELNSPEAAFSEFHAIYIHPDDFGHWKRTGRFQDGTILVMELVSV